MRRLILAILAVPALSVPALYALTVGPRPPAGATIHVSGLVTDAQTGRPLAGAQVALVGGGPAGALTGADGRYTLDAPLPRSGRLDLVAQMIGYARQARSVRPRGDSVRVDFALAPAALALEEVVVGGMVKAAPASAAARARPGIAMDQAAVAPSVTQESRAARRAVAGRVAAARRRGGGGGRGGGARAGAAGATCRSTRRPTRASRRTRSSP
ncbi:MAG: carboxypeptidase-like regulatory domain-containing protein [Gemmatimonadetes bacterium]|nr:carboxypeptidase-like regulatory domain-containing protein [Gemmatimonadota bacterium]